MSRRSASAKKTPRSSSSPVSTQATWLGVGVGVGVGLLEVGLGLGLGSGVGRGRGLLEVGVGLGLGLGLGVGLGLERTGHQPEVVGYARGGGGLGARHPRAAVGGGHEQVGVSEEGHDVHSHRQCGRGAARAPAERDAQ